MPSVFTDFTWLKDAGIYADFAKSNGNDVADNVFKNIEIARIAIFKGEAIRSFLFITGAAILIWLFANAKINKSILIPIIGVLVLFDLAAVDKSFINDKNFTTKHEVKNPFPETFADIAIKKDTDPNYRVLDITDQANGPFQSARASFFHKSIGGYHAAKLRRYQELCEHHLYGYLQTIFDTFKTAPTESSIDSMFVKLPILNMLNTRYLIYSTEAAPLVNKHALGNAWFVKEVKLVNNADEELKTVAEIDPATTVIVDKRYEQELRDFNPKPDPAASIKLTDYKANDLKYESNAASEQLAVFSEIYYKDGWNAYVDGELKPHFRGDWVLRAMRIPAGKHTVEFKFQPEKYYIGEKISLASSLLLFIAVIVALFMAWKNRKECEVK
jgi:hypothetical protein